MAALSASKRAKRGFGKPRELEKRLPICVAKSGDEGGGRGLKGVYLLLWSPLYRFEEVSSSLMRIVVQEDEVSDGEASVFDAELAWLLRQASVT